MQQLPWQAGCQSDQDQQHPKRSHDELLSSKDGIRVGIAMITHPGSPLVL
jgi:hypothetical protein